MGRRKWVTVFCVLLFIVFGYTLTSSRPAFAKWETVDDKQCFAIQFSEKSTNTMGANDVTSIISTNFICAPGDKDQPLTARPTIEGSNSTSNKIRFAMSSVDEHVLDIKTDRGNGSCSWSDGQNNKSLAEFATCVYGVAQNMDNYITVMGTESGSFDITWSILPLNESFQNGNTQTNPDGSPIGGSGDSSGNDTPIDPCYDGSGPLGWILCPVVSSATDALNAIYEIIEQDYLQIPATDLFDQSNGTYKVWAMCRDIANIVFVILLLVVILSQLTGVGISNYGIKKILPKLIITAVLINLSYIICQFAVDISNILGNSISSFLTSAASSISEQTNPDGLGYEPGAGSFVVVLGAGTAIAIAAIFLNPAIILAGALAVLSGLIAVVFLWVILIVRQAGVILLVALAPLAFCCFLLPNTEKLFSKWVGVGKALLLLYPICSLAVGGGALASVVLASTASDNTGLLLAAMIVQVIPFFFIPTLLKGSLAGLGNLGAKISSTGKGLSGKATNKIANSNGYKRAQERGLQRKNRILSGVNKHGELNALGRAQGRIADTKAGKLLGYNRSLSQKRQMVQQDAANGVAADVALARDKYRDDADYERAEKDFRKAYDSGDTRQAKAILSYMHGVNPSQAVSMASKVIWGEDGKKATTSAQQRSARALNELFQDNPNMQGTFAQKASEIASFISDGGRSAPKSYTTSGGNKVATGGVEDWYTASAASLDRNIKGGALSGAMAAELLNSTDSRVQSKLLTDSEKREKLVEAAKQAGYTTVGDKWVSESANSAAIPQPAPTASQGVGGTSSTDTIPYVHTAEQKAIIRHNNKDYSNVSSAQLEKYANNTDGNVPESIKLAAQSELNQRWATTHTSTPPSVSTPTPTPPPQTSIDSTVLQVDHSDSNPVGAVNPVAPIAQPTSSTSTSPVITGTQSSPATVTYSFGQPNSEPIVISGSGITPEPASPSPIPSTPTPPPSEPPQSPQPPESSEPSEPPQSPQPPVPNTP